MRDHPRRDPAEHDGSTSGSPKASYGIRGILCVAPINPYEAPSVFAGRASAERGALLQT
jgi:hypothetical protein